MYDKLFNPNPSLLPLSTRFLYHFQKKVILTFLCQTIEIFKIFVLTAVSPRYEVHVLTVKNLEWANLSRV